MELGNFNQWNETRSESNVFSKAVMILPRILGMISTRILGEDLCEDPGEDLCEDPWEDLCKDPCEDAWEALGDLHNTWQNSSTQDILFT